MTDAGGSEPGGVLAPEGDDEPLTEAAAAQAELAVAPELVATNLGRAGAPLIRYRTGDLVELDTRTCGCGRKAARRCSWPPGVA